MSERAPYSRVYWSIIDDEKFEKVYDDDRHLACWLRLLIAADQAWPASAHIPATARRSSVNALVEAGIVDLTTGGRYRIHGLDKERGERKRMATTRGPNGDRTVPGRGPNGFTVSDLAEPSQAEPSLAEPSRDPADIYWQLTGKYPHGKSLEWIDGLTTQYGSERTIAALTVAQSTDPSVNTLLGRTRDALAAEARKLDRRERAEEEARLAAKRAIPRVEEPWRAEFREAVRKQYERFES